MTENEKPAQAEALAENGGERPGDGEKGEERPDVHQAPVPGRNILIVGTAHVSKRSEDLVREVIREESPDAVCVELCQARFQSVRDKESWREMDIVKVIREKKTYLLLSHLLLAIFQKRVADRLGIRPGAEMVAAMEEADRLSADIHPVDRDIRTTLSRAWGLMGFSQKAKLLFQMIASIGEADEITEEDVEKLKEKDALEMVLEELGDAMPDLRKVLIDERDLFMAENIRNVPGEKVVAVVGAGHVPGILRAMGREVNLVSLSAMPKKKRGIPLLKWGHPLLVMALVVAGFFIGGKSAGSDMLLWWVAANGLFAGLGALLCLAHPLTILSAVLAAPLTSLNPTIAAGWVSGLVEAALRKPRVKDMETLGEDIVSFRGFYKNKVTHILLVVVLTNLGSMIGTFVALPLMLRALGVQG